MTSFFGRIHQDFVWFILLSPETGAMGPGTRGTDARRALRLVGRRLIISVVFVVLDVHLDGQCDGEPDGTMSHLLPQHGDMNLAHSSLQSALQIDPNQQPVQQAGPPPPTGRKRRKGEGDEPAQPAEPRRLRRSHEACARCRSKKIKASPAGRARRQIPVRPPSRSR